MDQKNEEKKVSFKDTLNLPTTDFPIRSNPKVEDPAMVMRWEEDGLYDKTFIANKGSETFILHDGPPYANAHIHLGTALNKILKDIATKSQRMLGKHVPVTPGWDCHGLPIELKVTAEYPGLTGKTLKTACRDYARKWIDIQREEFKKLGVLMDWNDPYLTMDFGYEADTLRAFGTFVKKGFIKRQNKTVPWCPSCQTVLATAEIEYADRRDPSVYVLFPFTKELIQRVLPDYAHEEINFLVWTTTPWTLPLNRALALKPDTQYALLRLKDQYVVVAAALVDVLSKKFGEIQKIATISSQDLVQSDARAQHPFIDDFTVPLIFDEHISLDDGTAIVHCAPGCGPQDYDLGIRNNLEIYSPITPDGLYDKGIAPAALEGKPVNEGQGWVITELMERGRLLHKESITHSYPHCWRCRGGLIFRATKQWFCDLSQAGLKDRALKATESIKTIPDKTINRLQSTLEGRLEWCLSRQRTWGTPIPALLCTQCDYTYISHELINNVADHVEQNGIEVWDDLTVEELLPHNVVCPTCTSASFKKEYDILDVWFDSGISHYAVLKKRVGLGFPADLYLEGKDQHRGWFQSSLLTGMVLEDRPPMKTIYTHGYTVDAKGRKMSKSLGNVVTPQEVADKVGTDGLRLWVSTIDNGSDAAISEVLLTNVQEVLRKVRNTARFLLSNLNDFDVLTDSVPFNELYSIDQYALMTLAEYNRDVQKKYADMDYTAIFHAFADYSAVELSAFYLDIIKDRLYTEKRNGRARRSAQTACYHILDTLTKLMAPILSFTAEHIADHYQKNKVDSIHLQHFINSESMLTALGSSQVKASEEWQDQWRMLKKVRDAVLKAIEGLREQGIVKHSLEAKVVLCVDAQSPVGQLFNAFMQERANSGQSSLDFLREFFIVSQIELAIETATIPASALEGVSVQVTHADGVKCPRCWQWDVSAHEHGLCKRCQSIL